MIWIQHEYVARYGLGCFLRHTHIYTHWCHHVDPRKIIPATFHSARKPCLSLLQTLSGSLSQYLYRNWESCMCKCGCICIWDNILIDTWIIQKTRHFVWSIWYSPMVDTWTEPSFFLGGSVLMQSMIWQTMSLGACSGEMDELMSASPKKGFKSNPQKSLRFPHKKN